MLHIEKILVPVEINEHATGVVRWAAFLAQTLGSRLTLLHVNESVSTLRSQQEHSNDPEELAHLLTELHTTYDQAAQLRLNALVEHGCEGLAVDLAFIEGNAKAAIVDYAKEQNFDLIVMGTHGRPWYQHLLLGSTAEAVLRTSTLPVIVVRNQDSEACKPQLKKLLFPSDGSSAWYKSESWLKGLAQNGVTEGGEIVLLHVIENPMADVYEPDSIEIDFQSLMQEAQQHPPRYAQPFWEHAHRVAEDKLQRLGQELQTDKRGVTVCVREGIASEQILSCAKEKDIDLIVMPTHGRTGLPHLLLGSVTEKVVRTARCPVLTVRTTTT